MMGSRGLEEEQAVGPFRHSHLRFEALRARVLEARGRGRYRPAAAHALAALGALAAEGALPAGGEAGGEAGGPMDAALTALAADVRRVRLFTRSQFEQLWARLVDATAALRAAAEGARARGGAGAALAAPRAALDAVTDGMVALDRFVRQNAAAAGRLAQLADAPGADDGAAGGAREEYVTAAEGALLGVLRLDPLLLGLSDAFEFLSLAEGDAEAAAAAAAAAGGAPRPRWVAPREFRRVTRKFWLLPADVARFKAEVARHLPVLVYGDRRRLTEVDPGELPFLPPPPTRDSAAVTSIYYDNPRALHAYHDRLRRADGAAAVRLRWYGARDPADPEQPLFVEKKVHREAYTSEFSSKERAPLAQRWAAAFAAGRGGPPELQDPGSPQGAFLREAQAVLVGGGMAPLLRTTYRRTAFQLDTDNLIRISLDTDLVMSREQPLDGSKSSTNTGPAGGPGSGFGGRELPGSWCRDLGATPLAPGEAVRFPYAVVEVKLQATPPAWLEALVTSGLLLVVPKFSKFLHGIGALYQDRTENVPHWFLPDDAQPDLMTPATWEEMADPSDAYLKDAASWLFPTGEAAATAPPPPPPLPVRKRLGPALAAPLALLRRGGKSGRAAAAADAAAKEQRQEAAATGGRQHQLCAAALPLPPAPPRPEQLQPPPPSQLQQLYARSGRLGSSHTADGEPRCAAWPVYQPAAAAGIAVLSGSQPDLLALPEAAPSGSPVDARSGSCSGSERAGEETGRSTPQDSAEDMEAGRRGRGRRGAAADAGALLHAQLSHSMLPGAPDASGKAAGGAQVAPAPPPGGGKGGSGGGGGVAAAPSARPAALVRTRVEPKTFFANERTFLAWLQISVLVMFLALSLLSGSSVSPGTATASSSTSSGGCPPGDSRCFASRLSGAIIAPVALLFMAYALFMYKKRTLQILRRESVRYDDQRGPAALVAILLAVMLISYVMTAIYVL